MELLIKQKYIAVGNKFGITDMAGVPVYYAAERLMTMRTQIDLFDSTGTLLVRHMEARLAHAFSWFEVTTGANEYVCSIDERMHWPWHRKAYVLQGKQKIFKVKAGPYTLKMFKLDEKGKYDKKAPVLVVSKKIAHVADTYHVAIDESKLDPQLGALIALWYDRVKHRNH